MATPEFIVNLRSKIGNDLLQVPTVCSVIFDSANRVLLMRHITDGHWSLPGGIIEPYESPTDAAVREVFEETGVHMRITGVVGVFGGPQYRVTYGNGDKVSYVATAFRGERIGGELAPDGDESSEVGYFGLETVASMRCSEIVMPALDAAFRDASGAWYPPPGTAPW